MIHPELGRLFFREIEKLLHKPEDEARDLLLRQLRLLELLFQEVTREERIQFSTLFSRMAFAFQKLGVDRRKQFVIHHFRKQGRAVANSREGVDEELLLLGFRVLADATAALFGEPVPEQLESQLAGQEIYPEQSAEIVKFVRQIRLLALRDDASSRQLIGIDEQRPGEEVRVQYGIAERNDNFNPTIALIRKYFRFPLQINLIEVQIDADGVYRPRAFVVEPDYLVDVTSIAECCKPSGHFTVGYLLRKFLPVSQTKHLMLGNIANFFLDELMADSNQSFQSLFPKVFRLNPLAFALFDDTTMKEIHQGSKKHFVNLREMVVSGFQSRDINPEECFLEPTFFSEMYGLQGRLDVFFHKSGTKGSAIVELKSGSVFKPNRYRINQNHYTQTLLYDLIIRSVYGREVDPLNYILYSKADTDCLRFAPVVSSKQMEAMEIRNELLAIERQLADLTGTDSNPALFSRLSRIKASGFEEKDLQIFSSVFQSATPLERKYFLAFAGMVAREHQLARVGIEGLDQVNGQAALWRSTAVEKEDQFGMLRHLQVVSARQAAEEEPLVTFRRTAATNPLANFRQGDIAVLYPSPDEQSTVLRGQVFKCTITTINDREIVLRLRSRQMNTALFETENFWNLEPDMLDGSFNSMYKQLFAFLKAPADRRSLWLGQEPPAEPAVSRPRPQILMTAAQALLFQRMIAARDYFLLWGPPGTGKTSIMLKAVAGYLWQHTSENVLILAYTNRAVDEICESIADYHPDLADSFLRIGSRFSTDARFQRNLLSNRLEAIDSRATLRDMLDAHRIVVSTVASLANRTELLTLKRFDRVILDEASQVIEPLLIGLLPHFPRAILIGDHRQLPAVVTQGEDQTRTKDSDFEEIGLDNLRNSLFDRLYRLAIRKGWTHAFGQLTHQGRMHKDIMAFPNHHFYSGFLHTLPEEVPAHVFQNQDLNLATPPEASRLEQALSTQRVVFLPAKIESESLMSKTNLREAETVVEVIHAFQRIYQSAGRPFHIESVGVIAPYRAQIALIKNCLSTAGLDEASLTVDTVERYQGGARDIIIMSLCANHPRQLQSLVSLSSEGVDRKLNVALTRARNHLILIGNPDILRLDPRYAAFINQYSGKWQADNSDKTKV
jgi:DNA replication ATP-dependent helicase Dna2